MKILLVQMGFIGDAALSTPVLTNLRALYPEAEICTLSTPLAAELFAHHPAGVRALSYDKRGVDRGLRGFFRMLGRLRAEKFDAVFSLHKSLRTAAMLALSGIAKRYGFSEAAGAGLYHKTAPRADLPHDVLRNLAIFRVLGREPAELEQRLMIARPAAVSSEVDALLAAVGGEFVALAPGSVWPTKRWTAAGFAAVARHVLDTGRAVVLLGGPQDAAAATEVCTAVGEQSRLLNLVGQSTLLQSVEIVARAAAVVTNDSAPLHFASAVGTPVVALFCATIPEFGFGPWQVPAAVLGVEELSCRPCGRHGPRRCPTGTNACQRQLKSEWVMAALDRFLTQERHAARI